VGFWGEPETEFLVRIQHLELLLEHGKPRCNQMQILKANPFTLLCSWFDGFNRDFVLATTHSKFVITGSSYHLFRIFLQFCRRVRPWRYDEQNWLIGKWFTFVETWEREWSSFHYLISESFLDKLIHARFETVRSENLNENATLERRHTIKNLLGEFELWLRRIRKLGPHLFIIKL